MIIRGSFLWLILQLNFGKSLSNLPYHARETLSENDAPNGAGSLVSKTTFAPGFDKIDEAAIATDLNITERRSQEFDAYPKENRSFVGDDELHKSTGESRPPSKQRREHGRVRTSRRYHLRRRNQTCNIRCNGNARICTRNAEAYSRCRTFTRCTNNFCADRNTNQNCNTNCGSNNVCQQRVGECTICRNGRCANPNRLNRCNLSCSNNGFCASATDGCTICRNGRCASGNAKCNQGCSNNSACAGASDGCTLCQNNRCARNNRKCGLFCQRNPSVCNGATDGCSYCDGYHCVSRGRPTCNSPCNNNNNCVGALNGCTSCRNGRCTNTGGNRGCVSSAAALASALNSGGNVQVCSGAIIRTSNEIVAAGNNLSLTCGGGTCLILGSQSHRLMHFTGSNIRITGITFENGSAIGDGGALLVAGGGNQIRNCVFIGNRATGRGGAASIFSGTYAGNTYAGNYAPQCIDIFQSSTGYCFVY